MFWGVFLFVFAVSSTFGPLVRTTGCYVELRMSVKTTAAPPLGELTLNTHHCTCNPNLRWYPGVTVSRW